MSISRRNLLKLGAVAVGSGGLLSANAHTVKAASLLPSSSGNRVVIVGGGWGGVSTARAILKHNRKAEVVLIEKNGVFMSCPMSNLYLAGLMSFEALQFEYSYVGQAGVKVFHETVTGVDRSKRTVSTSGGTIKYDYLVLAPGIDYMWESIEGLWEARYHIPIAFKPGNEHLMLKRQLQDLEGGNLVVGIPKGPIRCPPGPYERVAMMAHYIKSQKIKAKLIVLDANPKPMSKGPGFLGAYKELYGDIVEYNADHKVEAVDHKNKVIRHSFGETRYSMANIIPEMKAGAIVHTAGVSDGRWVQVNPYTMQTKKDPRVFVVGDVIGGQPFPKSGFMASSVGKAAARQIAAIMQGKKPGTPKLLNTCFSTVDGDAKPHGKAIDVTHNFSWNSKGNKWDRKGKANLKRSTKLASTSREWAEGIWFEMFGG